MSKFNLDLFVIGAGSGGIRAAKMAARYGARVAIAEQQYLGGTCVNVGCVPKKLLVYSSLYASEFDYAKGYGWDLAGAKFSWQQLILNKNREILRLNGVYERLLSDAGIQILTGKACIAGPNQITINDKTYTAERILIATGGRPAIPDIPGKQFCITSNDAFFLEKLPEKITLYGGGYIAVEFAGIFNGLGVDTTLVCRGPLLLRGFDHDAREFLVNEMRKKGIKLLHNDTIDRIDKDNDKLNVQLHQGGRHGSDMVMCAIGRQPNTDGFGLEAAGVKLDAEGAAIIDDSFRTSVASIYAIGDVTNRFQLTPVAIAEGTALADALFAGKPGNVDYENIPTCVFSQPNLAKVGLTEEQARQRFTGISVFKSSFTPLKHTMTGSVEKTFIKLVVDKQSDRVIGAHMVGAEAGEIIQGLAVAMKAGATKAQFDATLGIHPTAAEEFVTMRKPAML